MAWRNIVQNTVVKNCILFKKIAVFKKKISIIVFTLIYANIFKGKGENKARRSMENS